ncbi:CARD- and ANK-domain containing inflammasome adapter protein-like [Schistocerca piceifrons]|uniref:CARD- and ANK-domain containing inflammasome adapter protein-like n=1 Tax=Schistocerca piceifrons TaxID=274613 RepID=UPI001F5FE936|nr:CARD- and ANK-domain containing inflammasome adapter protein-like [Schistocerca piceifrons]
MAESERDSLAGGQGAPLEESGEGAGVGQATAVVESWLAQQLVAPETAVKESVEALARQFSNLSREEGRRRLMDAAEDWDMEEIMALVAAGADVRARDECESTALHRAAESGHVEAVKCLLEAGAEVDARDRRQVTPLHLAAYEGHTPVVRLLLGASADPNARDLEGRTPLHEAARGPCRHCHCTDWANSRDRDPKEDNPFEYRQTAE